MKYFFSFALALLLSQLALAQCTVAGKVTNAQGDPVVGAHISLLRSNKGALTDENGRYQIEAVAIGPHELRISHVSYLTINRKINVPEKGSRYLVNAQLIEAVVEMDELIVKSTRAGAKTPITYTNLDKAEIEKNNLGQDVPFLLRWTPSAVVSSDAGAGVGYTGIRIRGTDPTRINVTINGIPVNDAESQGVFWVNMPDFLTSTDDIQIQRGVGTSTNGAGAFGATINMNTNKLKREAYGQSSATIGSFNTQKANLSFGTGLIKDKFAFDGRLSSITSDGYIDRASSDLESYYLSGVYMGKNNSLRVNIFSGHEVTYQAWNGVPAQFVDDDELRKFNTAGTEKSGTPYDNEVDNYQQDHYQAFYNHQVNPNLDFNIGLHYTKGRGYFEQYKADEDLQGTYGIDPIQANELFFGLGTSEEAIEGFAEHPDLNVFIDTVGADGGSQQLRARYLFSESDLIRRRWLDNDFYGATYALNYTSEGRRLSATLGGGWNRYEGRHFGEVIWARYAADSEIRDLYYDNDAIKTDFNIFGKVNYQLTNSLNGYLDLQYRRVDYSFLGINDNGSILEQDDALSFFNPKAGLFYELSNNVQFYASFAVANREPNRNDYTEAPPRIRPEEETLYNTEIGYRQNWTKASLSVNFYHMYYRNQLALTGQINDVGAAIRTNIPTSYRAGIEIVGGMELAPGLELMASATFSQNKIESFTERIDDWGGGEQVLVEHEDTDLALSPNVIASGELSYQLLRSSLTHHLEIAVLSKYVGEQFIDNTSNDNSKLDDYFFSDLRLSYNWKSGFFKDIGLTFTVHNMFDQKFSANAWTYRFLSEDYDPRADDTFARSEGNGFYNLTGFFPQAGRHYMLALTVGF